MLSSPGARLRQILGAPDITVLPGVYDAITARVAASHGFGGLYMTGAGTVNAHLGLPDIALVTLTEMVENAARIATVVDVPVLCDADTGFGNATNVMRTVTEYERAGAGGIHLEDQEAPKRCGHLDGKRLISVGEMQGKIAAAVESRRDPSFVIVARVDAAAIEGVDAAVSRAREYVEAGADAIFAEALTNENEFAQFGDANVGVPLIANMTEFGKTPYLAAERFGELGFSAVLFPMLAFRMMLRAVDEGFAELARSGTQTALLDRMRTRDELYDVVDYPSWSDAERRFVSEVT